MSQEVAPQFSTRNNDKILCCMSMSSQSCILVVGGTYIGSTRSSHKCHKPSSYSVLRKRVSQSWVLSDSTITSHNSNTKIEVSRSSTMSPECLWITRGLAPAGSAGAKM